MAELQELLNHHLFAILQKAKIRSSRSAKRVNFVSRAQLGYLVERHRSVDPSGLPRSALEIDFQLLCSLVVAIVKVWYNAIFLVDHPRVH